MGTASLTGTTAGQLTADFHLRLVRARREAGFTQRSLADAAGVSRNAVTHWERPQGARPTLAHLSSVARLLGVSFEWLCTGRGRMHYQAGGEHDGREGSDDVAMILRYCAQDETEERILLDLRRLSYPQVLAVATLVSALAEEATPPPGLG